MTLSLTHEQENRIRQLINSGRFASIEEFVTYSLHAVDVEEDIVQDEAYNTYLRGLLAEAQGKNIVTIPRGELANELKRRREARQHASDKQG
jgi:Arc/MetJ-type ribon-helix-helix transcriptional regulator